MERITSRKNAVAVHLKKLGADASYRRECGEFVCDGKKLLAEALAWGAEIRTVLCAEGFKPPALPESVRVYEAPGELLEYASYFKTPPDVLFSCAIPEKKRSPALPFIVLENVQDPGNVGTVLRTADAFGADVLLLGACADAFSPKTVRASMGAAFRREIFTAGLEELPGILGGAPLYGAALGADSTDIRETDLQGAAVAVGSEGRGLSDRLLEMCTGRIIIPMSPRCESLNAAAAAAVVLWEMKRRSI